MARSSLFIELNAISLSEVCGIFLSKSIILFDIYAIYTTRSSENMDRILNDMT